MGAGLRGGDRAYLPGSTYPLGASLRRWRHQFLVLFQVADRVELCLFDDDGTNPGGLPERNGLMWHGYLPRVGPGSA